MAGLAFGICTPVNIGPAITSISLRNVAMTFHWRSGICTFPNPIFGNEILIVRTRTIPQDQSMTASFTLPEPGTGSVDIVVQTLTGPVGEVIYSARIVHSNGTVGTADAELIGNAIRITAVLPPSDTGNNTEINVQFLLAVSFTSIHDFQIVILTQTDSVVTTILAANETSPFSVNTRGGRVRHRCNLNNMLRSVNGNQGPIVEMMFQTDMFGNNLGEMNAVVLADRIYPDSYPLRLIGLCEGVKVPHRVGNFFQTLYSARPCLESVLKLGGDTLQAQTNAINARYESGVDDCEFYNRILAYSTLKYFFAGLVFGCSKKGCFNVKWLLRKYNERFFQALLASEFRVFVFIFINPEFGLVGFERYYRCCEQHLGACRKKLN